MADIDRLQIEITVSSDAAEQQVRALNEQLKELKSTLNGQWNNPLKGDDTAKSVEKISNGVDNLKRQKVKLKVDSSEVTDAEKKVSKLHDAFASLKRIVMYRLLRSVIKLVTDAIKEGLENAYAYSQAFGGEIAPALDRIASAWAQLKNQLGAAFGQALVALEPLLVQLIQLVTKLAQAFTWLFAVLSGSDKYLVANDVATSWNKATKEAGAYRKMLLGIDEINRMDSGSGGGGGTGNISDLFHWEPTNFELPDLTGWIAPLIDKINSGIDKIKEFIRELLNIPEDVPVTISVLITTALQKVGEFVTQLATIPALVFVTINVLTVTALAKVRELAEELGLLKEPVTVEVKSRVTSPVPVLERIRETIDGLVKNSPYIITLTSIIPSPLPKLAAITAAISLLVGNSPYIYTIEPEVVDPEPELNETQTEFDTFLETVKTDFSTAWESVKSTALEGVNSVKKNIETFTTETIPKVRTWGENMMIIASEAFFGFAKSAYDGLSSAAQNIVSFANGAASTVYTWATGTLKNFASWANGVISTVGNALKSAWESFKSFMSATGEAIGSWFVQNKDVIIPVAIGAAVTIGAIALAAPTGGLSLAALALAKGGIVDSPTLFYAGEAGKEAVIPLERNTEWIDRVSEGLASRLGGNNGGAFDADIIEELADRVINAIYAAGNQTVRAIEDKNTNVSLDGNTLASALYEPMQRQSNIHGSSMVQFAT